MWQWLYTAADIIKFRFALNEDEAEQELYMITLLSSSRTYPSVIPFWKMDMHIMDTAVGHPNIQVSK